MEQIIEKIRSKDGTPIGYQRSGTGAPLVLVHGTLGSSRNWPILPALEQQFTVYAMDRRGRGESGDSANYALEREAEDIAALINSIGDEVSLLGHSYGGLCALEAALLTPHIRRLVLYEPAPTPVPPGLAEVVNHLQDLLDNGDREGTVMTFLRDLVEMPAHELELLKASPVFPAMVAAAHTIPRELQAEATYRFAPERFRHLNMPIRLLSGEDSPQDLKATVDLLHAALPSSRVVVLPGQQHIAQYTAPDLFVRALQAFLVDE